MTRFLVFLMAIGTAWSYIPRDPTGTNIHRSDFANIQFLVNQSVAPGLTNADGRTWITADSDPLRAISAAFNTWNAVPTSAARFAPIRTTTAVNDSYDRRHVIVFADTPANRSLLGSDTLAMTTIFYTVPDGTVTDTDIIFNPSYTFSTSFSDNTIDLQALLTHELGHALGANHTNVLGATMFQATGYNDNHQSSLSSDDVAFVNSLYPAAGGNGNGTLRGRATLSSGAPIRGGLITALDPATGTTVGALTSFTDGSFHLQAPPGNYFVYIEPMSGYVRPGNLAIPANLTVDTAFASSFLGGNDNPSPLELTAGANLYVALQAAPGTSSQPPFLAVGQAGGSNDVRFFRQGPLSISSGQLIDLLISGAGLDSLNEEDLRVLGAGIAISPGSLRQDDISMGGFPVYRVTLDVSASTATTLATIVVNKNSQTATLTGVIAISPPQTVNAGSYLGGAVSPGEVAAFFGTRVGPSSPAPGEFDVTGALSCSVGDVSITFDGVRAPLFYVSPNQINFQVPYEVAGKQFTTMVATYAGKVRGQFTIPVAQAELGIVAVTNADGSLNSLKSPARMGTVVVVWGTGAGMTSVPAQTGKPSPPYSTTPAMVTVGGVKTEPIYAGLTPDAIGLIQVNFTIPPGITPGNAIPLKFSIGSHETQTVNIAVR